MNFLNNTFVTIETAVGSSDRIIFAKNFVGNLGTNFPLSAVIAESDDTGKVIKREIIKITGKNDKMLNVERAVEPCPQSDDAENPTQNPLNFSENAVIYHTLTAGDLEIFEEKILDVRKISDIRWKNRKPSEYESKTFYWPELVEGSTVWINETQWVNLHTYIAWNSWESAYSTQLAITAQGNMWIWVRKARNNDNWWAWQKVFPFSATALDISGLAEATEPVLSDELLIRSGWENKKVTADNLRKWNMIPFWNNSINKGEKTFDSWGGNTESYAVPRWGIVTIGCHSHNATYDYNGSYYIEHSTNNSSWNSLHNVSINSAHKTSTIIVPPGFIRLKGYRVNIHYTIQAFS